MMTTKVLSVSAAAILAASGVKASPVARIGATDHATIAAAATAARAGDVIRVLRDADWGKSFMPTGSVVTVDLAGHRISQYFWLSSGGTICCGEVVPRAGWVVASFYGDGVFDRLSVTNAPADSALIGFGRAGVTVEIRSGEYTTGALVSTTADTAAQYRLRITGGRFSARMWYDPARTRDGNEARRASRHRDGV